MRVGEEAVTYDEDNYTTQSSKALIEQVFFVVIVCCLVLVSFTCAAM